MITALWILGALTIAAALAYLGWGVLNEAAASSGWLDGWQDDPVTALSEEVRLRSARIDAGLPAPRTPEHPSWGQSRLRSSGIIIPDLAYCQAA